MHVARRRLRQLALRRTLLKERPHMGASRTGGACLVLRSAISRSVDVRAVAWRLLSHSL